MTGGEGRKGEGERGEHTMMECENEKEQEGKDARLERNRWKEERGRGRIEVSKWKKSDGEVLVKGSVSP